MVTQWTVALRKQFAALKEYGEAGADKAVLTFATNFDNWKAGFPGTEYTDKLFGKDAPYIYPPADKMIDGELWHVHLMPLTPGKALALWHIKHDARGRKTSDRTLVYATKVDARVTQYLLLYIIQADAHDTAAMRNTIGTVVMPKLVKIANFWIKTGRIIG